jgi:UDPglucose--hexose-1-phosphate uridylyltransferase
LYDPVVGFRKNPLSGELIVFAPERAARRSAFGDPSGERCPFCPGHESDTPPELARTGEPWRVRVFPNKYPPVAGAEVIVESPDHVLFHEIADADEAVRTYVERYRAHASAEYVALFKNEGSRAGASIAHIHSQVIPLPFVPPRIARELRGFADACPLCAPAGTIIRETETLRWLAPEASSFAYQQWIVPKRHVSELSALDEAELRDLAALLGDASRAMQPLGAYNWMFMNFPRHPEAHCYIDVVPRLAALAGLELGTGTFVEIIDPEAAARRMRET